MPGLGPASSGRGLWVPPGPLQVTLQELAGSVVASGLASGDALVAQAVAGSVTALATVTATPSQSSAVSGSVVALATVSAVPILLSQAVSGSVVALATVGASPSISCSVSGGATGSALLSGAINLLTLALSGSVTGTATVKGNSGGGIFQKGGVAGGDIIYDDDLNADASLDGVAGSYHYEDIYQKSQANGWKAADLVTAAVEKWGGAVFGLRPEYWFHVTITNGDGVSVKTTTLRVSRCTVKFDAGKTQTVSAVGIANRWTIMGLLQETVPGSPLGYDGIDATFGATTTIDGNHQLYGSTLRTNAANSGINIRRTSTSAAGDCVTLTLEALGTGTTSAFQFGTASVPTARTHHIYTDVLGSAAAGITLFNVLDPDDIHAGGISNIRFNIVNAYTLIRDGVVHGTPATADIRGSAGGTDLVDFTWSGATTQQSTSNATWDWRTYLPNPIDSVTGASVGAVSLTLQDKNMAVVLGPIVADANGLYSYTLPGQTGQPIANAVVTRVRSGSSWSEQGPFTATYTKAGYAPTVVKKAWPRTTNAFGDQLEKVEDMVPMRLLTVGPTADFRLTPGGGTPGVSVLFTDESLAGDAAITSWLWDFGDGQSSTAQNPPLHVYSVTGSYAVTLTVTSSLGTNSKTVISAVVVSPIAGSIFTRRTVPTVPYEPVAGPSSPAFVPQDLVPVVFERQVVPGGTFRPCGPVPSTADVEGSAIIFSDIIIPVEETRAKFRHRQGPTGAFKRKTVPGVDYQECGTPRESQDQEIIFGDTILPVE